MYRIYETAIHIASASEYGRDMYANALKNICQIQCHVKKIISVYWVRRQGTLFDFVGFRKKSHKNLFVIDDACITPLFQHKQLPFEQHVDGI